MHNYDLDRVASKARSIEYESDIVRVKNLAYEMIYYINSADSHIIRMEKNAVVAEKSIQREKEKNELLTEENRQLRAELEQANRLNEALAARLALKDIYSKSGSQWYSNEGSMQAKSMRETLHEFEGNNKINSNKYNNIDFNLIYQTLETDNEKNRNIKRKEIAIAIMQQAANELTTELVDKAEEQINLITDINVKSALLEELAFINKKVNSKMKRKEIVNNVKKLFKSK